MGRRCMHTLGAGGRRATSAAMASLAGRVVGSPRLSMRAARSWRFGSAADAGTKAMLVAWTSMPARASHGTDARQLSAPVRGGLWGFVEGPVIGWVVTHGLDRSSRGREYPFIHGVNPPLILPSRCHQPLNGSYGRAPRFPCYKKSALCSLLGAVSAHRVQIVLDEGARQPRHAGRARPHRQGLVRCGLPGRSQAQRPRASC